MKAAIDARDGTNLSNNQNYKDVLAKLPADQIVYGYMDMSGFADTLTEAMSSQTEARTPCPPHCSMWNSSRRSKVRFLGRAGAEWAAG